MHPLKIAVTIPCGPSPTEETGVEDIVAALAAYEPGVGPVWIINDRGNRQNLEAILERHHVAGKVLDHPRAGQGNHWLGRLTFGLLHAMEKIRTETPDHHILKIDTDGLIVGPFVERLGRVLESEPAAGMIGSTDTQNGRDGNWWEYRAYKMSRRITRLDGHFWHSLTGPRAKIRRLILRAVGHGYRYGQSVIGGSYLITAEANRRIGTLDALRDVGVSANDAFGEDIFFGFVVSATGLKIVSREEPGWVFGVRWKGLAGQTLEAVAARDNPIIHSVKDEPPFSEKTTREFFRVRRPAPPASRDYGPA